MPRSLSAFALALACCLVAAPPRPAAALEGGEVAPDRKPVTDVIRGKVLSFDGRLIEARYDFSEESQLLDFPLLEPFRIEGPFQKRWWDRSLHLKGTGGVAWKVVLRRQAEVEFEGRFKLPRDVGGFIAEERESDEFALFSIYDQFFQNKDTPGSPRQHMICRFLQKAPDSGGERAFRYVIRTTSPEVIPGKVLKVAFGRRGADEWMEIAGDRLAGSESQWPELRGYRPGLYVIDNELWVSSIVLRGEVDPEWLKAEGVDPELQVRPATKKTVREPTDADLRAMDVIAAVGAGERPAASLIAVIEDSDLLPSVRADAGKALAENGDVKLVPRLVPLLESPDPVCRAAADRAVTRLAGRSFGFDPDAPEDRRRKAVRSLIEWIDRNPAKFR